MSRVKVQYRSGSKEVYGKFCLKHPEVKITFTKWKEVIEGFAHQFRDYILGTGEKGRLPGGLGVFAISKKKIKKLKVHAGTEYVNLPIDWQKTRKAGKRIYNFNTHTDGYRFRWHLFQRECRFSDSDIWNFKPSRDSSRGITKALQILGQKEIYKQWQRHK